MERDETKEYRHLIQLYEILASTVFQKDNSKKYIKLLTIAYHAGQKKITMSVVADVAMDVAVAVKV